MYQKLIIICYTLIVLLMSCTTTDNENKGKLPKVASGTLERLESFSSKHVTARNVDVWLPEGYTDTKKYAVLYMHDGQMLYDATTTWNKQEWGVDEVLSGLIAQGKVQDCIVVGVWNDQTYRHADYAPQKALAYLPEHIRNVVVEQNLAGDPRADRYLKFLVEELKPAIDEKYSTYTDAKHTFVMGSSMGGLISMYAFCEYPEVFSAAACLSTHWVGGYESNEEIPAAFRQYMAANLPEAGEQHRIYFDYGTETLDSLYEPYQQKVDLLMSAQGYTEDYWVTRKFEGADHSEDSWKKRLSIPLEFLLGK